MASKTTQIEHARGMSSINHQDRDPTPLLARGPFLGAPARPVLVLGATSRPVGRVAECEDDCPHEQPGHTGPCYRAGTAMNGPSYRPGKRPGRASLTRR